MKEKKLSENFYPYYHVSYGLFKILWRSKYYKSIDQKYKEYLKSAYKVNPNEKHKTGLNILDTLLKNILKNYSGNKIEFQTFNVGDKTFCLTIDNKYLFNQEKLNEDPGDKWRFWILIKILQMEKVKIEIIMLN